MLIFSNFHETLSKETFKTSYFHVVVDLRFPKHPTFSVTSLAHYRIWGSVNGTFSNKLKHPQRPSEPSQLIGMVDTILKLCFSCIRFLKFQLTKPCVLIMLGRPEYPRSLPPPPPPSPPEVSLNPLPAMECKRQKFGKHIVIECSILHCGFFSFWEKHTCMGTPFGMLVFPIFSDLLLIVLCLLLCFCVPPSTNK